MSTLQRALVPARQSVRLARYQNVRSFHRSSIRAQHQHEYSDPKRHGNFYKSHGRAIAKAFTLAFFSYQVFYWAWISLEAEYVKDKKEYEIKSLETEVRLLEEGRRSHRPAEITEQVASDGKRILEEKKKP